jgi:tripartite-type tricarboxylate transporter receptor subunit TctC
MSRLTRRSVLAGMCSFIAKPVRSGDLWPSRPITLVHGFAPGGATDTVARIVAEGLSRRLGQPITIDAKPGASGTVAAAHVARAAPDGYTLIAIPGGHATNAALYRRLPYRSEEDFSMISMTSEYPFVVVTSPEHTIKTLGNLVDTARSRQKPLTYGSPGIGTVHHLAIELFARTAGIRLEHVPYRGSAQTVTDLIGNRIDFMIDPPTLLIPFLQEGKLRALGVTGAVRFSSLPEVPSISETVLPGYTVTSWQALAGPARIPPDIVGRLNREVADVLAETRVIERLKALGNEPKPCTPDELKTRVVADIEQWTTVVAAAKIERI